MDEVVKGRTYRDRSAALRLIGGFLLLAGIGAAFAAPVEIYGFYLFGEGGRFHYDGFGFGSFMFGVIAAQAAGYYLIAAAFIPLGYGHLAMRRWVPHVCEALLRSWLVVCLPVTAVASFILAGSKDMTPVAGIAILAALVLCCFAVPWFLIRFYRGANVRATFEARDPRTYGIEKIPVSVLVPAALDVFLILVLQLLVMLNGVFPVFGSFLTGYRGILLHDVCMLVLAFLAFALIRGYAWARPVSVAFWSVFTLSVVSTLAASDHAAILEAFAFPARELEFLAGLPFQGYHYAVVAGLPLFLTLGVTVAAGRPRSVRQP